MSERIRRITVYCGANKSVDPIFPATARALGRLLVSNNIGLVYGGGSVGMMGVLADTVLELGGKVKGVIPRFMVDKEWQHPRVTDMDVIDTQPEALAMAERMRRLITGADAAILLAGGRGSAEELFHHLCGRKLGHYKTPVGIVNTNGYYDGLVDFLNRSFTDGFDHEGKRAVYVGETPEEVLVQLGDGVPAC